MPKLSPLQWAIAAIFLAFYGFAVFAVTRDYYLRNPLRPVVSSATEMQAPHAMPPVAQRTWIQNAIQGGDSSIPAAITESNPVLLRQKADDLFGQQRYGEAIPLYRRVLELDSTSLDAYNDLGLSLYYAGQLQAALDVLREGTAKDPSFQRIWLTLGFVSFQGGDKSAAKTALEKARSLGPDNDIGREAERMLGLFAKE
jgi:tetratricopeptide (TPR) repeat protein